MTTKNLWIGALLAALAVAGCNPSSSDSSKSAETPTAEETKSVGAAARRAPTAEGNTVEGDTIKIGLVAAQSGDLQPWGVDSVNGARLAVDEVNKAGGINGKKIQLVIGDSQSRPEQGKSATEKLIDQDKVVGVLGEVASGITAQMAIPAFERGVPIIAIGATRTDLSDTGSNFFRVCYTDDFQGPAMATFAYRDLNLRNIAIVTDNSQPYSQGLSESFRKAFEALGGRITGEEKYESRATEFRAQLTRIKEQNPDGIFASGYFNEVGPLARQVRELGIQAKLLGGDGWDSSEILTSGGEAILGGFFCNHYSNLETDRKEVADFLAKWKAKYGGVPGTTMGALSYDATMLMIDALKRSTALNSKALIEAIENTENFPGVSGSITLKGMNGNPRKRALVVELTKDGQKPAQSINPEDVKTGS